MSNLKHQIHIERLGWFIGLRWGAVAGAMVLLLTSPWLAPAAIPYRETGVCVLALGILNGFYLAYWNKLKAAGLSPEILAGKARLFFHLQMAADLALLTTMLCFSGGAKNPLILFFLFHLAISAILFSQAESLFYAGLALVLPWVLYFSEKAGGLAANPWPGISGITGDHERSLLWAYSAAVAGLWFFLSRLGLDLDAKEQALRETGEKLQAANGALKQLDVFKNQFLKQVVSQLKKPAVEMNFDLSAVESAMESKNEKTREALHTAKKRIWTLLELIEDLVWLSRAKAGDAPLKKISVNVYETLLQRIQVVEGQARQKGITFQLHGDAQVRLTADLTSFERVADNLFSNAIKYTPVGESHVAVNIRPEGNWLVIAVEDEGIGIPSKQREKLFQEFFRASNAKAMEKFGTGLGLSIVKQVMGLHGGRVSLSSGPQKGTKVETWWPLTRLENDYYY